MTVINIIQLTKLIKIANTIKNNITKTDCNTKTT